LQDLIAFLSEIHADAADATEIVVLRSPDGRINSAAFSPDGSHVITASGGAARIWGAAPIREITVLRGHGNEVSSAAFSPNGSRIVTASEDGTARIWDAATAREIAVLHGASLHHKFRRIQPRRFAHRHGVVGQDRPHLGRGECQGNRGAPWP